jgi:ABC-type branched-subunit amino acid transport system ATPase component
VPAPFSGTYNSQSLGYQFVYSAAAIVLAASVYFFLRRITESPFGRSLRAMRDNDNVADSLGKDLRRLRMSMLVVGGMIAGLSGGILVGFITLWAPSAWTYAETIVLFAAVIIGGAGNHKGAILGAIIVPLGFEEITRFLPAFGPPALIPALEWVAIGLLIIVFLWFRPQGVLPERRRILSTAGKTKRSERDRVSPPVDAQPELQIGAIGEFQLNQRSNGAQPKVNDHHIILSTEHLTKSFDGVTVVSDMNIAIEQGRLTGLIGPNGAGKSTTLALLAGTLRPTSGRIFLDGTDITNLASYRRARLGLVRTFQLASEFKKLTVLENLVCAIPGQPGDSFSGAVKGRRYWGDADRECIARAEEVLEAFGLTAYADVYAGGLSGGQRRLVEIMRALLAEPRVLLLDEPMAGLHPNLARRIGEHLTKLCREGMTIVMVEHELSIIDEFCEPVIVMAEGAMLAEGTMTELRANTEVVEAYLVG